MLSLRLNFFCLLFTLLLLVPGRLVAADLDFGTLLATPYSVLSLTVGDTSKIPLMPGESVQVIAKTYPENTSVTWSVTPQASDTGEIAKAYIDGGGNLQADVESGNGWVRVRAEVTGGGFREADVFIGCTSCTSGTCAILPGNGFIEIGSVNIRFSLGKAEDGMPAGDLKIYSRDITPELGTPKGLQLSSLSEEVREVFRDGVLRQVRSPQTIVDILPLTDNSYELFFYPSKVGGKLVNDLFEVAQASVPQAVWRITGSSDDGVNRLTALELRGGESKEYIYEYDQSKNIWSLSKGNGLRFDSLQEKTLDNGDRVVRASIEGADRQPVEVKEYTHHTFEWGEELVAETLDPDNLNLITTIDYYEEQGDGYGRVKSRIFSDGSWVRYEYDGQGRITRTLRPWLDASLDSPEEQLRITVNDYRPLPGDAELTEDSRTPRTVTKYTAGIVTGKNYHLIALSPDGGRSEITEQCASQECRFGDAQNIRSEQHYYPKEEDKAWSGRLRRTLSDDGQLTSYSYEFGTVNPLAVPGRNEDVFIAGAGRAIRTTITHGTSAHPNGIPRRTTRDVTVTDWLGNQILEETYVLVAITEAGSVFERIDWSFNRFDDVGRRISTSQANGTRLSQEWACCGLSSVTDEIGITTTYNYDDLGRQISVTNQATGVLTETSYDAAGRSLATVTTNGGLTITRSSTYDAAGRLTESLAENGVTTLYEYNGTDSAVFYANGATEFTSRFLDGKTKSNTGLAIIASHHSYGVNADGSTWHEVTMARPDSPRYRKSTMNFLGRTILSERPGFSETLRTTTDYDEHGRVIATSSSGSVPSLQVYNELAVPFRKGLDADNDNKLTLASMDRISDQGQQYLKIDGDWWLERTNQIYASADSDKAITTARQLTRLTGWQEGVIGETISEDIRGNQTITTETLHREKRQRTITTKTPDANRPAVRKYIDGRLIAIMSPSGVSQIFGYDGLGRKISVTDGRIGNATTTYNDKNQVVAIKNAAGDTIRYEYDPQTGKKIAEINPAGKTTHYDYNLRGQLIRTWGDVPYPVSFDYNDYGEKIVMRTYRQDHNWRGLLWPQNLTTDDGDTTLWSYHEASGLLIRKTDAQQNSVLYEYDSAARLSRRIWARGVGTSYSYLPTGEPVLIDYSDDTPDISVEYDRLGRKVEVRDGYGTRKFNYGDSLELLSEKINGKLDSTITRRYDNLGRKAGFDYNKNYTVSYGYDKSGRFDSIGWSVEGNSHRTDYSYLENSNLLASVISDGKISATYEYEPHRNLRTSLINRVQNDLISQYTYQYDRLSRRVSVQNNGSAFKEPEFTLYSYNDRNELAGSRSFVGSEISDQTRPQPGRQQRYDYDPIGNRNGSQQGQTDQAKQDYLTNSLNQYEFISGQDSQTFVYDLDGNLTEVKKDDETFRYIYNGENRLVSIEKIEPHQGDMKSLFAYDYMGRRVQKQVMSYNETSQQYQLHQNLYFFYDDWNLIEEVDTMAKTKTSYVWGLDLSQTLQGAGGIGGLLARVGLDVEENEIPTAYYFYDANGNVRQLVSENGELKANYEYDGFGKLINAGGPLANVNPYRFSSKYYDEESSLYYYGYRFYSPELGRWVRPDPIEEKDGLNLHLYVRNNPVGFIDALGEALYAIDGTWFDIEKEIGGTYSNVHDFYAQSSEVPKTYYGGPGAGSDPIKTLSGGAWGDGASEIVNKVYDDVCNGLKESCEVNLVGWSRGAVIALKVAHLLNSKRCGNQRSVSVNFLGLYDAVEMMPGGWPSNIPANVKHSAHAIKTASQPIFPTLKCGGNERAFPLLSSRIAWRLESGDSIEPDLVPYQTFESTHGDIGADQSATGAHAWMLSQGRSAGVDF